MPTIERNKEIWDGAYQWANRGDEWSETWGGPNLQWYGSILPRIFRFLPSTHVLEIACGFGRWTNFLKDLSENLSAIDLSEECIEACKKRFEESSNIEFILNDGKSLDKIADESVDFVFSYDSLVHADRGVLDTYLSQMPRILKPGGAVFIHHSNFGEYSSRVSSLRKYRRLEMLFEKLALIEPTHMRDPNVTAEAVEQMALDYGLQCVSQEIVPWGTKRMHLDCFSTMIKAGSKHKRNNMVFRNSHFMQEARNLARLSHLYDPR